MRRKRNRADSSPYEQLTFESIKLNTGDQLFKNGTLYAVITGESEELYFLRKVSSGCDMSTPYFKQTLIDSILFGKLALNQLNYK